MEEKVLQPKIILNDYVDINLVNKITMIKPDGSMDVLVDATGYNVDEFRHMRFFRHYFETHFLDDKNLQQHGKSMDGYCATLYLLAKVHNIVLVIDTSIGKAKDTYATIQLPNSITKSQEDTLNSLRDYINLHEEIYVLANPTLKDGVPGNMASEILPRTQFDRILDYTEIVEDSIKR